MGKSQDLWEKAKEIMPGGSQLLSKRSEMFLPDQWPSYYKKAKGVEIEDLDENKYVDMSYMGVGPCILGYADEDVDEAVKKAIDLGVASTLNCPEEVELAELLLKLHPWAGMVRFARSGGESVAIAIRIARARSGKDKVAFCGYHGWHDWYLSSNLSDDKNLEGHLLPGLSPKGVPRGLQGTAIPFQYNRIEQLEKIIEDPEVGTIIMEPIRHQEPENGFLQKVRDIADKHKCVLIFDEISSGFRLNVGGAHLLYKVVPDIAVFAKSMSNGFPMGAVIGKKEVMDVAQETFISSTNWTERLGPVAALATIKKMIDQKAPEHMSKIGQKIGQGWENLAKKHGLDISTVGPNVLITFSFNYENAQELTTLFTQEMLKRGYLAKPTVYVSFAHTEEIVNKYLKVVDEVFGLIRKAISDDSVTSLLEGPVAHQGFFRLT